MKKILKPIFSICIYIFVLIFVFIGTSCRNSCRKKEQNHIHNYDTNNIKWEWSLDEESAVAILTCESNKGHQERINASISKEATTNTIILTGIITYNDVKYSDKKEVQFSPGLEYTLNEDGSSYHVIGIGTCSDKDVKIPSIYNQLPVTSINDNAFLSCYSLKNIKIPNSITDIGVSAFNNCYYLQEITLSKSIKNVGKYAFSGCSNLWKVSYNGTIEDWCGINFENSDSNPMSQASSFNIKKEAGIYDRVSKISIPETITIIKQYQFVGFNDITEVELPNTITSVEKDAFLECTSLKYNEYNYCSYLGNKTNPYLVLIELKDKNATDIITHLDTKVIGSNAFGIHNRVTNMTIQSKVTHIGDEAFTLCGGLTKINIPGSVIHIGKDVFPRYGNNLETIEVDKDNPIYDSRNNCNAIIETATNTLIIACQNTIIPNDIANIGDYAFQYLNKMKNITIPKNIKNIGEYAFINCRGIKNVYYEGTIEDWCQIRFVGDNSNPTGYGAHFYIKDENNEYFEVTKITIPNTITSIGNFQFDGFEYITSVEIPNNVVDIGDCAFYGCASLVNVEIPDSVIKIGEVAFSGCTNLIKVIIGKGTIEMWENVFYNCTNLKDVVFANTSGWQVFEKLDSTEGKPIDVTDPTTNATILSSTYEDYYWKRLETK